MGVLGIALGIVAVVGLAIKKWNAIFCGLIGALAIGLLNGMDFWTIINKVFLAKAGGYISTWFMVFFTGAIYAKLVSDSGSAMTIAYTLLDKFGKEKIVLTLMSIIGLLTYGGMNMFVIIFVTWPICIIIAKEINVAKGYFVPLIYGSCLGAFYLAVPGTPTPPNVVATQLLGVSSTAGPVIGMGAAIVMLIFTYWFLSNLLKKYRRLGKVYDPSTVKNMAVPFERAECPSFGIAVTPLIILVALYVVLSNGLLVGFKMDSATAVNTSMLIASVITIILNYKRFKNLQQSLLAGSLESVGPVINMAFIMGFAAVAAATPAFASFVELVKQIPGHPYFQVVVASNVIGIITGSASATIILTLECFKTFWLDAGVNPEVLARIITLASNGLSFVPYSGGLFAILEITRETHKSVFLDSFMASAMATFLGLFTAIGLALLGFV